MIQLPHSAADLMPHKPPMRLIDTVLSVEPDGSGTAETVVRTDNIFLDRDGALLPEAVVELMAQAFAAVSGSIDLQAGRPGRTGYLVGVKKVSFPTPEANQPSVSVGDRLTVGVRPTGEFAGFVIIDAEVRRHDDLLAQGELKIWIASDGDEQGGPA
ncbi:3-hydroxyacyl-ACP dehydratase [Desulfonatronum sp. SC1]|uniref:ApeP family dehydratase n=1 Tax=Desulfonatronum sp. SC1 TaxID=2109626 RepID=UPI000D2FECBE|nr:3-hydroxyacyl-ACP dehydratase [Desulfonatronum sp. SC1]PTN38113.1 3-hydroxyacyl-ACP dehydratase [Desulfonatronum sp. SC1]